MVHPIAGLGQYPFNINGLQPSAANLNGNSIIDGLFVIQQRSSKLYDLMDEVGNVYQFVELVYRNRDGKILNFNDENQVIADSLPPNSFCIKEYDLKENKEGFGIDYQYNKIKLHNGEVIFRRTTIVPDVLKTVTIKPDKFDLVLGSTMDFELVFNPPNIPRVHGKWSYNSSYFELVSFTENKITLLAKSITQITKIGYNLTHRDAIVIDSVGSIRSNPDIINSLDINPNPANTKVDDQFEMHIVYDPLDYTHKGGKWTVEDQSVVKIIKTDTQGVLLQSLKDGSTNVTFTLDYDNTKTASAVVNVTNSTLESVSFDPPEVNSSITQTGEVNIKYVPDGAFHGGVWSFNPENIVIQDTYNSTPDVLSYVCANVGKTTATFTPTAAYSGPPLTVDFDIGYSPLSSLTLSPSTEAVKIGDDFYVDITYEPETAEHTGSWNTSDFEKYVSLEDDSTPDKAHFKAVAAVDSLNLIFSNGDVHSQPNVCKVSYPDLVGITITPEETDITHLNVGDSIHFDITYNPTSAEHVGEWVYDSDYFKLNDDSTPDKAHFTALKITPTPISLVYKSGNESDHKEVAVLYDGLESITLSPREQYCTINNSFFIDIEYKPTTANHTGTWNYDTEYFLYDVDAVLEDKAVFKVIKTDDKPHTLTYTSGGKTDTVTCTPDYIPTTGVKLSPTEVTAPKGTTFKVDIFYEPDGAEVTGSWDFDKRYIEIDNSQQEYEETFFKVIERTDDPVILTYTTKGGHSAQCICHAQYDQLMELKLDPLTEDVGEGDDFYIDITYIPDTAQHNAQWTYDSGYLYLMPDSTFDKAHFTLIKKSEEPLELTLESNGVKVINTCNGNYDKLTSIILTPNKVSPVSGDKFVIDIEYVPETANHTGLWTITDSNTGKDATDFVSLDNNSTSDVAVFSALKLTDYPVNLTYTSAGISQVVTCEIDYDRLKSLSVSPKDFKAKVGENFDMRVVYDPDSAEEGGKWAYNSDYIEEVEPSGDGVYTFKLIGYSDDPLTMKFTANADEHIYDSAVCTCEPLDVTGVSVNPTSETVKSNDEFYIDVTYEPHGAEKKGSWNVNDFSEYVSYNTTKSTPDRHYFKAIKESDEPIDLVFSSGDFSATNKCTIDYAPLTQIEIIPLTNDYSKGEIVPFKIKFTPDNARHVMGEFSGDLLNYMKLQPGNTTDAASFLVTGFDKSTVDSGGKYTLTYTVPGVEPASTQLTPTRPYATSFTMTNNSPITCKVNDSNRMTYSVVPTDAVVSVYAESPFTLPNDVLDRAYISGPYVTITRPTPPEGLPINFVYTGKSKPPRMTSDDAIIFHATSSPIESYTFFTTKKLTEATVYVYGRMIWLQLTNTPSDAVYEGTMDYNTEYLNIVKHNSSFACTAIKYTPEPQIVTYTDKASGVSKSITIHISNEEEPEDED